MLIVREKFSDAEVKHKMRKILSGVSLIGPIAADTDAFRFAAWVWGSDASQERAVSIAYIIFILL